MIIVIVVLVVTVIVVYGYMSTKEPEYKMPPNVIIATKLGVPGSAYVTVLDANKKPIKGAKVEEMTTREVEYTDATGTASLLKPTGVTESSIKVTINGLTNTFKYYIGGNQKGASIKIPCLT